MNATSPKPCWAKAGAELRKERKDRRQNKDIGALFMVAPLSRGLPGSEVFLLYSIYRENTYGGFGRRRSGRWTNWRRFFREPRQPAIAGRYRRYRQAQE